MCVSFKLDLLGSLGNVTGPLPAAMRPGLDENGVTVATSMKVVMPFFFLIKHKVHAGVINLLVHHAGEAWNGVFNVNLGAIVRLDDVGEAPSHCACWQSTPPPYRHPWQWYWCVSTACHIKAPLRFCWSRLWRCPRG